ncbi:MAG TPA: hypothetical protein VFP34_00610 [Microlunatus sp.]|nr:hypothetical protein [Microlunatus sp.]
MVAFVTTLCIGLVGSTPAQAAPAEPSALSGTVTGRLQDGSGRVKGLLNVIKFKREGSQLLAVGKFIGTITEADGTVTTVHKRITMPVATEQVAGADKPSAAEKKAGVVNQVAPETEKKLAADAAPAAAALSCQVLDLVLGPLDLNLLGLKVHLDTVHLNITAQGGPGNLLGNLLCAVAGLLDGSTGLNGILNSLVGLLNRLLGVLG